MPFLFADQTSDHNQNDFINLLTPELEVTPVEVNFRSGRSVCVMYT